jgi:hypothetical protein
VAGPVFNAEHSIKFLPEFMHDIGAAQIPCDVMIFGYTDSSYPQNIFENGSFIKKELERLVLGVYKKMPIWNCEWRCSPADVLSPQIAGKISEEEKSAWVLSYGAQVKTLMRNIWDEAVMYRGTRPAVNGLSQNPPDSCFFNLLTGEPKPAYWGCLLFDKMSEATPLQIQVKGNMKDNPITVLAGKSSNNKKLNILIAYWKEHAVGSTVSLHYDINITNFYPTESSTCCLYTVDKSTKKLDAQ